MILYSDIVKVLAARPWWQDSIVALATIAVPILAALELGHSGEANRLRTEANELRREENRLQDKIGRLMAEHAAERKRLSLPRVDGIGDRRERNCPPRPYMVVGGRAATRMSQVRPYFYVGGKLSEMPFAD